MWWSKGKWCEGKENGVKERKMNGVKMEIQMTRRLASRKNNQTKTARPGDYRKAQDWTWFKSAIWAEWLHQAYTLALIILPAFRCLQEQEELPLLKKTTVSHSSDTSWGCKCHQYHLIPAYNRASLEGRPAQLSWLMVDQRYHTHRWHCSSMRYFFQGYYELPG